MERKTYWKWWLSIFFLIAPLWNQYPYWGAETFGRAITGFLVFLFIGNLIDNAIAKKRRKEQGDKKPD